MRKLLTACFILGALTTAAYATIIKATDTAGNAVYQQIQPDGTTRVVTAQSLRDDLARMQNNNTASMIPTQNDLNAIEGTQPVVNSDINWPG